jgi:hypothetical protein
MTPLWLDVLVYISALLLLTWGGNHATRLALRLCGATPQPSPPPVAETPPAEPAPLSPAPLSPAAALRAGRVIGGLERLLIMLGLAANSWEVVVAVVALKTVGRYKDLDRRLDAEYFLVGSLSSILWALLVAAATLFYDRHYGLNIGGELLAIRGR